jgi:aminoglycoside phosphotransferase (APT) family kinase protein
MPAQHPVTTGITTTADGVLERVSALVDSTWAGARVTALDALPGGTSSLTYLARLDGTAPQGAVVKMAPPGLAPVRNRDVLRQARVLRALRDAPDVPVPEVFAEDPGAPPEVPPMFLMSFVEGESVEPVVEPDTGIPGAELRVRALGAARALAGLQSIDPVPLAEPAITPAEELARWDKAFATVPAELARGAGRCGARLAAWTPEPAAPVIQHGDWRLGNMLSSGSRVNAVIDWEIWAVGDPRLDVAWFLLMTDPLHPGRVGVPAGMPSPDELLDCYEQAAGRRARDLEWFEALVRYKQAAATALIAKNARKRGVESPIPEPEGLIGTLLEQAGERLAERG